MSKKDPILETDARLSYEVDIAKPSDLDLEPINSEEEDYESAPADYQISTYPADFTLEGLHQKWKAKEIRIPTFQRNFVWKQVQAAKLIESFLVGLPVPAVFFYTERKSQNFFVIDGQQRLKSIFYFFEGFFGEEEQDKRRVFKLAGLSPASRFKDKSFEELREEDQKRLRNAVLRAFVVQQLDPNDDTSVYHIFERLNTGGTLLTNQEVRNCVFHGAFISFLDTANKNQDWRRILGKPQADSRKKDAELIVRFLAMRDASGYQKPMKDYLTRFMRRNRDASDEVLASVNELFSRTCKTVLASLGSKPFHVRAGLNSAVFDSVMVAFAKHLDQIPQDIKARYDKLVSDETFDKCTRQSTTDVEIVRQRLETAEEVLFGE